MKCKKLTISSLVVFLLLSLAATSFAGLGIPNNGPNIGTEAGIDIVASEKAKTAAVTYDYNNKQLALVGTEAGAKVIASEKAKTAAATYNYNDELLALVGTEGGKTQSGVDLNNSKNTASNLEHLAGENKSDTNVPCRC